ncbi:MAG TPA: cupredoxin domain-containing protein [Candidatus Saccharimonadales bacterium]|nr:cupredoxin domain-containing protein [Candidatus Saccharimonadales bacterium]
MEKIAKRKMLQWAIGAAVVIVAVSGVYFGFRAHNQAATKKEQTVVQQTARVSISSAGFMPGTIKIRQGQMVTWTNQDTRPHQIASDIGNSPTSFGSDSPLARTETFATVFDTKGMFTYHDQLNPLNSKATVIVE